MPWVFNRRISITHNPEIQNTHLTEDGEWGDTYEYTNEPPQKTGEFRGELLTAEEIDDLVAAADLPWSNAESIVTLNVQGVQWQGNIISLAADELMGAEDKGSAVVVLSRPTKVEP